MGFVKNIYVLSIPLGNTDIDSVKPQQRIHHFDLYVNSAATNSLRRKAKLHKLAVIDCIEMSVPASTNVGETFCLITKMLPEHLMNA